MIQSISDIITNSSSEVFIIDSNKHRLVAKLIEEICEVFGYDMNKIMEFESVTKDGKIDGWDIKYKKGNLLIHSSDENSIPSIIMTLIEELKWDWSPRVKEMNIKNVRREHLG